MSTWGVGLAAALAGGATFAFATAREYMRRQAALRNRSDLSDAYGKWSFAKHAAAERELYASGYKRSRSNLIIGFVGFVVSIVGCFIAGKAS